jgi:pilus assembly protein Flp/PilA
VKYLTTARAAAQWLSFRLNLKSDRGATAVEYAVMVALIAAVIILAVVFLGRTASSTFSCTGTQVSTQGATTC